MNATQIGRDMRELFFKFIECPDRDSYLAVCQSVVSSTQYNPYSDEIRDVHALVEEQRYEDARSRLSEAMPNLLLSPRAHLLLAMIADKTGDKQGAQAEGLIASLCAKGILATGNGSKEKPYVVVRTSDEHDVVQFLGKRFSGQALVEEGPRCFDVIQCDDGSELWFDITVPYNKLQETFRAQRQSGPDPGKTPAEE